MCQPYWVLNGLLIFFDKVTARDNLRAAHPRKFLGKARERMQAGVLFVLHFNHARIVNNGRVRLTGKNGNERIVLICDDNVLGLGARAAFLQVLF